MLNYHLDSSQAHLDSSYAETHGIAINHITKKASKIT